MRYVCPAILIALSVVAVAPAEAQTLSISGYQLVSLQPGSIPNQWFLTYNAQLVNSGPALGSVTATLSTNNPYAFRTIPGSDTLSFAPVPANSQVTSLNTFRVLSSSTTLDLTQLNWSFQGTPVGPIANPGSNQTATVGSTVQLNGSGSTTPSGSLSYSWKFFSRPFGSSSILIGWTSVMPSFVVDVSGTYVVTLTISNGTQSNSANVTISTTNTPPVANAGQNQTIAVGATALLNGSASSDVDGNPLKFSWTMVSLPGGSSAALIGANTVSPSFIADVAGTYKLQLVVNDGFVNSAPSQVTISTKSSVPVANAGPGQVVTPGTTVQLDGSGSTDSDGNPLSYQWSLIGFPQGTAATLSDATAVKPTFVTDLSGDYIAQLEVTDGAVTSSPATVTITTTSVLPPVANAGTNQTVAAGTIVNLSGSGIDPQSLQVSFLWSLTTKPTGSAAKLSNTTAAKPTFTTDLAGTYIAQLIVNNGTLNSAPATVTINATAPTGIQMPASLLVAPGASIPLNVMLGSPAAVNGVFVSLSSSNPSVATVTPAFVIPGGMTASATIVPKVNAIAVGSSTITATAQGYPQATTNVQVAYSLNFSPGSLTISGAVVGQLFVFSSAPAPAGGLTLNISSSNTSVATVPSTVTIKAGTSNVNVPVTAVASGTTVIHASAANITDATANVTVSGAVLGGGQTTITAASGSNQNAAPGSAFAQPLVALLKDATSSPISGATVTFTAPSGGASGSFAGGVNTAVTDASGLATSASFTANSVIGVYSVSATAAGVTTPAVFSLTNTGSPAPAITITGGNGQKAAINAAFSAPLTVTVTDSGGNPINGATVTFTAPTTGASALFAGGANTAVTNAAGQAISQPITANASVGVYTVSATVQGISTSANFTLTNLSLNPTSITITDGVMIGSGLQVPATITLGSPAPAGGLVVSIVTNNLLDPMLPNGGPRQIEVAPNATAVGTDDTSITIPAGSSSGTFYVHGVGNDGSVTYTVSAQGYTSQTATLYVAQSGFVVATSQGFGQPISISLSAYQQNPVPVALSIYSALLNPASNAFAVNQELAGGTSITLSLSAANADHVSAPSGFINTQVTITGSADHGTVQFIPQRVGTTIISVVRTPGSPLATTDGSVAITVTP